MNNRNSPNEERNISSGQNRAPLISYIRRVFSRNYENGQIVDEQNGTSTSNTSSTTNADLLRMVWTRMQLSSGNNLNGQENGQQEDSQDENENSQERRYPFYDEDAESQDELENPQKEETHLDYQIYPLKIDWAEIENEKSSAYAIWDKYGYFGVAIFTTLSKIPKLKLSASKFYKNIIDYYISIFKIELNLEKNGEIQLRNSMNKLELIENFIKSLPDLSLIRKIIHEKMLMEKEIITIKIILDIYGNYFTRYDYPLYQNLLEEYIPTALQFYSSLSEEEIVTIYDNLVLTNQASELKSKIHIYLLGNFLFLDNGLNFKIYRKRKGYINHLAKMKNSYKFLIRGLATENFIK